MWKIKFELYGFEHLVEGTRLLEFTELDDDITVNELLKKIGAKCALLRYKEGGRYLETKDAFVLEMGGLKSFRKRGNKLAKEEFELYNYCKIAEHTLIHPCSILK